VDVDPALEDEVRAILEPRESLYRSEPKIDDVERLMERVRDDDPTLTELDLCSMNIGLREDALSMFDALSSNTHVKTVDLSMNELDDDCVSSLSLALLENKAIKHLNLANNAINSEGAECKSFLADLRLFFFVCLFLVPTPHAFNSAYSLQT